MTLEQYLAAPASAGGVVAELRETATAAVKVDLALRAVADAEGIEATDDDLDAEFAGWPSGSSRSPTRSAEQFERADQIPAVRSDIKKRKALEWLIERVEIVDEDGNAIDRADLELATRPTDADDDSRRHRRRR